MRKTRDFYGKYQILYGSALFLRGDEKNEPKKAVSVDTETKICYNIYRKPYKDTVNERKDLHL